MMRLLVLLHRWLGIGFCLLFAMWFATGIVMHFVPFPSLTETERVDGLIPIAPSSIGHGPSEAAAATTNARRIRLIQRVDGPVYIIAGSSKPVAVHASDLSDASVTSVALALQIGEGFAHQSGIDPSHSTLVAVSDYDQWSVPNGYDDHRPLYRVALNDVADTELYVSSRTGEIVLKTTGKERAWNYLGSVAHWIYPTVLRSNWAAWDRVVWNLSLAALIAAVTGTVLGLVRLRVTGGGMRSPFRGWHAWHHILGLVTATFVMTWIFSGWLSMDHGRLFSRGRLSPTEAAVVAQSPDWARVSNTAMTNSIREVEWFGLGQHLYRRERTAADSQSLFEINPATPIRVSGQSSLSVDEVGDFIRQFGQGCAAPVVVGRDDPYPIASMVPGAPVYRSVCGDVWFQIDSADGTVLDRLDSSRRSYRWLYTALHTFNFPILLRHPMVRSILIVVLCGIGLIFSVTGIVIGWRRLRFHFPSQRGMEQRGLEPG